MAILGRNTTSSSSDPFPLAKPAGNGQIPFMQPRSKNRRVAWLAGMGMAAVGTGLSRPLDPEEIGVDKMTGHLPRSVAFHSQP
jgi:hypothetical protein